MLNITIIGVNYIIGLVKVLGKLKLLLLLNFLFNAQQ